MISARFSVALDEFVLSLIYNRTEVQFNLNLMGDSPCPNILIIFPGNGIGEQSFASISIKHTF